MMGQSLEWHREQSYGEDLGYVIGRVELGKGMGGML